VAAADKLLLLFALRGGAAPGEPAALLRELAAVLSPRLAAAGRSLRGFVRRADDPFARGGPPMRGFDATLELRSAGGAAAFAEAVRGLDARLEGRAFADLTAAVAGTHRAIVPPPGETPIRYQYVMRRRRDLTHAQYLEHYLRVHAEIGRHTPGIAGYVQFHADPDASRQIARAAGLGLWDAASVSELHLRSVEAFLSAVATWEGGQQAIADEENFIDRRNSVMFTSDVVQL
jgi:hypothetical protein